MHKKVFVILLVLIFACQRNKDILVQNQRLLGFKADFLAEIGDDKYDSLYALAEIKSLDIRYINDIIYVSQLLEVNSCANYNGNIEFKHDTIVLLLVSTTDDLCTSLSISRFTYLINNPKKRRYIIEIEK